MFNIKLQYCSSHSLLKIATGSSGWRSNSSGTRMLGHLWGPTESTPSMTSVVCWEHGGRCQRGRRWRGVVAGWTSGGHQRGQACPPKNVKWFFFKGPPKKPIKNSTKNWPKINKCPPRWGWRQVFLRCRPAGKSPRRIEPAADSSAQAWLRLCWLRSLIIIMFS